MVSHRDIENNTVGMHIPQKPAQYINSYTTNIFHIYFAVYSTKRRECKQTI